MVVEPLKGVEIPEEYPIGLALPRPFTVLGGGKDNSLTYALSGITESVLMPIIDTMSVNCLRNVVLNKDGTFSFRIKFIVDIVWS